MTVPLTIQTKLDLAEKASCEEVSADPNSSEQDKSYVDCKYQTQMEALSQCEDLTGAKISFSPLHEKERLLESSHKELKSKLERIREEI